MNPVASIAVPISTDDTELQVRYTFADGSQSVVSKPFVSADDYRDPVLLALNDNETSRIWLLLAVIAAIGTAGAIASRRRYRRGT